MSTIVLEAVFCQQLEVVRVVRGTVGSSILVEITKEYVSAAGAESNVADDLVDEFGIDLGTEELVVLSGSLGLVPCKAHVGTAGELA